MAMHDSRGWLVRIPLLLSADQCVGSRLPSVLTAETGAWLRMLKGDVRPVTMTVAPTPWLPWLAASPTVWFKATSRPGGLVFLPSVDAAWLLGTPPEWLVPLQMRRPSTGAQTLQERATAVEALARLLAAVRGAQ